jgi:Tfp pilus assembly protein PilX
MALVITLLLTLQLSVIGWGAFTVSHTNQKISGNYLRQAAAFNTAESGIKIALANLKHDATWKRTAIGSSGESSTGTIPISGANGAYTVTVFDSSDDATLDEKTVRLVSQGTYANSTQTVEVHAEFAPDPGSSASSPAQAVITEGVNDTSGHPVGGYDEAGCCEDPTDPGYTAPCTDNCDPDYMISENFPDLSTLGINEDALKLFADFIINGDLTQPSQVNNISDFWENQALQDPYIIHVTGDMDIAGNDTFYGIYFVEGEIDISAAIRIHGVIYAPNSTAACKINGGGSPGNQPVMGQLICGPGGINASGNHANVQYVSEYVDAFNNYSGSVVDLNIKEGTWRQY